jgi:hypothetical protein
LGHFRILAPNPDFDLPRPMAEPTARYWLKWAMDRSWVPDPPHRGGCLCGAVRYSFDARPLSVVACHCLDCQKFSGATNLLTVYAPRESFTHEQGEVDRYRKRADSGNESDYFRCAKCGVRLWHEPLTAPSITMVAAGTLDDPGWAIRWRTSGRRARRPPR